MGKREREEGTEEHGCKNENEGERTENEIVDEGNSRK
jgi:hypothetical protein